MTKLQYHEQQVQIAVYRYLTRVLPIGVEAWHVPNGGALSRAARGIRAAMGERPGVSDLMFLWAGTLYCMECKIAKPVRTNQSDAQVSFQRMVEAQGGRYEVVRGIDDARRALESWGVPTREKRLK